MRTPSRTEADVYVIVVRDFLVHTDLVDTVREFDPLAIVLSASDCGDATALIAAQSRIAVAFIEAGPAEIVAARLDRMVADRRGRLVLLGDAAEDAWEEGAAPHLWPTLLRPFSSQAMLSMIEPRNR